MNKYMGFKLLEAEPMTLGDYNKMKGWTIPENEDPSKEGYVVKYSDDYISWSPKDVFEASYLQVKNNPNLASGVSVSQEMVDNFIKEVYVQTIGTKTTLVRVELSNGFEIVESSSCVDAANYNETMGKEICLERIKNKVWELLGFLLQTAYKGIK
jgi:hypothetical protein